MEIQQHDDGHKGMFFIASGQERLAEMTYVWTGSDRIIIDHTEVSEKLKGQGAGKQLVAAAVDWARKMRVKIMPLCPFARSVFDKTPDYADVLF